MHRIYLEWSVMMKRVYSFNEGNGEMSDLLGGKGSNLAQLTRLKMPVPSGLTITTQACLEYLDEGQGQLNETLLEELNQHLLELEKLTGKKFNDPNNLLLVSVRSGAKFSMPGMMDTILNIGLNDKNVEALAQVTGDERFAYDCFRRLIQMYGNVVYEIPMLYFDEILNEVKEENHYRFDYQLTAADLKQIINRYEQVFQNLLNHPFPQDVYEQIYGAVKAVFQSWNNDRARTYRRLNHIPHNLGTAVNIQEMVFGNLNEDSGTGVLFTRNPATGEDELYGEYLLNAQGEDVVAGIRTPEPIAKLKEQQPAIYEELYTKVKELEHYYRDMQDIEFTVEDGRLYLLQTRKGKRTAKAACRIAVEMVEAGIVSKEQALLTLDANAISQLLHPSFNPAALAEAQIISDQGLPASPGAASGAVVFTSEQAVEWVQQGKRVILVRHETSPEDIEGMNMAEAIVTCHGGMTSHAAVVARGMGKCCVTGCESLSVNETAEVIDYPGGQLKLGDMISVNGDTGEIYLGEIERSINNENQYFDQILEWAKTAAGLKICMNAETKSDIEQGLKFGAEGIGLVRTEHMFFPPAALKSIRQFILASSSDERQAALDQIVQIQQADFESIYSVIKNRGAVIRLLDLPLHEFLPKTEQEITKVANELSVAPEEIGSRIKNLTEQNPMLGHRGCRLAMTYPEIYLMQAEAIIRAAARMSQPDCHIVPEIMIPLVCSQEEITYLKKRMEAHLESIIEQEGWEMTYHIGSMIETPRACLIADQIAEVSDFISYGTNDLTQMTYGFSRDDVAKFLHHYLDQGVLEVDPFQQVDTVAVAELLQISVERARKVKPDIKLGICGEHGGNPASIHLFKQLGFTYVSCSPFRIPIAIIAAAQAEIEQH